jgi:serine acetyltransferase
VLQGYVRLFEPQNARRGGSLLRLIISDYLAYYAKYNPRNDSPRRLAILFIPRMLHNPCLRAGVLLRLALASPGFLHGFWRSVLISRYTIDIQPAMEIGPGFTMPHPFGIALGWGLKIGTNVSIVHHVSIGSRLRAKPGETQLCPVIEDDVTIYTNSMLFGPITIGKGATIGAGSWVTEDVPPGTLYRGVGAEVERLRAKMEAEERAVERQDGSPERQVQD